MGSWFPQPPLVSTLHPPEDAMMEDTASRRGYAPTAAWDEGNMFDTGDGTHEESDDRVAVRRRVNKDNLPPTYPPSPTHPLPFTGTLSSHVLTPSQHLGLSRDCSRL